MYKAFVAIDHAADEAGASPSRPGPALAACLAYLFAASKDKDRGPYDGFWRALTEEDASTWPEESKRYRRQTELRGYLAKMLRDMNIPQGPQVLHLISRGRTASARDTTRLARLFWEEVAKTRAW